MVKSKLKLHGFNNLTKSLSFNIYDICYAETQEDQQAYVEYIDEQYDAQRLTQILTRRVDMRRCITAQSPQLSDPSVRFG